MHKQYYILIILLFAGLFMAMQQPVNEIQLGGIGCFHSAEAEMDLTKEWYGLFISEHSFSEVKKVQPVIKPCHDPIFDEDSSQRSGKEIFLKDASRPQLLIGGTKLKEGKIETAHLVNSRCIFPGDRISFHFNGSEYSLMAIGQVMFDTTHNRMIPYVKGYRVYFVKNQYQNPEVQELFHLEALYSGEEAQPSVFFAGDIDGDGKPDLLYNLSNHYNVGNVTLFLSSKAESGKMLKMVASRNTTGC
jgi:hypothetical protein